jgi:murein DD-endopeptidase MepM/ murein hydrolase activator NlpD
MRPFSHPVSFFLRPVFQAQRIRAIMGANLAAAIVAVNVAGVPIEALGQEPLEVITLPAETEIVVTTQVSFRAPLAVVDISQGFRGGHRGIDLRSPVGTPVQAVAAGKVVKVTPGRFGYGKWILVDHENGVSSLYAHLSKITVVEGEAVTQETVLGEVGMTGWATGPHLHLEVYENGRAINPTRMVPLVPST